MDELKVLTQQFYDAALSIFTGEWLELEVPEEMSEEQSGTVFSSRSLALRYCCRTTDIRPYSEQSRLLELATLRKVYVPELVLRLHHVLVESRSFIPQCVKKTFAGLLMASWRLTHV